MSGPLHPTGRGRVNARRPQALGLCDRCQFTFNHRDLRWQFQWQGTKLQNLEILVCHRCLDKPQIQLKTIILPPDPVPILNPRPEFYEVIVPSFFATESATLQGDDITTEDGNNLVWQIQNTPTPDPNNPSLYP